MFESDLYKELGALTKDKDRWKESIPYVSSLLAHDSVKIRGSSGKPYQQYKKRQPERT